MRALRAACWGFALAFAGATIGYLSVMAPVGFWLAPAVPLAAVVVVAHLRLHPWWPLLAVWAGFTVGAFVGGQRAIAAEEPLWLVGVVGYVVASVMLTCAVNVLVFGLRHVLVHQRQRGT